MSVRRSFLSRSDSHNLRCCFAVQCTTRHTYAWLQMLINALSAILPYQFGVNYDLCWKYHVLHRITPAIVSSLHCPQLNDSVSSQRIRSMGNFVNYVNACMIIITVAALWFLNFKASENLWVNVHCSLNCLNRTNLLRIVVDPNSAQQINYGSFSTISLQTLTFRVISVAFWLHSSV